MLQVMNDNKKVLGVGDTQTLLYAACKAPVSKLEAVRDDCEDWWNRVREGRAGARVWFLWNSSMLSPWP